MLSPKVPRVPWGVLAIEVAAIFFSVFLAFGVTEWRESRKEDQQRRAALENFRDELVRNRGRVVAMLPYQRRVRDRAQQLLTGRPDTLATMGQAMGAVGWRGPGVVFLEEAAWVTAEATGALGLLEYETASAVSGAYAIQHALGDAQQRFLTETAYNPLTYDPDYVAEALGVIGIYFEAVSSTGEALAQTHAGAITQVYEALGEPVPDSLAAAFEPPAAGS